MFIGMEWNHCFYVPSFIIELDTNQVDMPSNSVAYLNQIPIFEWYVISYGSKSEYQKKNVLKRLDYVLII